MQGQLLKGKVAIITGASSGIGWATARVFARHGAKLVLGARREHKLHELAEDIRKEGGEACAVAGDVTLEAYNKDLVEKALSHFGKLDVAFNNAGMLGRSAPVSEVSLDEWNQTLHTNLTSGYLAAKYQIPAMREHGGSLIFTSSFVGNTIGFPGHAAYAASKAGVVGLVKALACEYGTCGVRVNALLPGGTATDMAKEFGESPEVQEFVKGIHALKRVAQPEEMAHSALYLASDLSSFTTGTAMLVEGGVSINKT